MNLKILKFYFLLISGLILSNSALHAATEIYVIDPAHSSVEFHIRHVFSKVAGRFQKFEGTITVDREAMEKNAVAAAIDVGTVDTNQEKRDAHLRSKVFFEVDKYPKMTFQSKSWKKTGQDEYEVSGDLSLHGVTKPVVLAVKSLGFGEGVQKTQVSGWEVHGQIKRSDFGVSYGIPAVGDDVEIDINIEAKKQ